ncbi:unnamed protein product [Lota lota]
MFPTCKPQHPCTYLYRRRDRETTWLETGVQAVEVGPVSCWRLAGGRDNEESLVSCVVADETEWEVKSCLVDWEQQYRLVH